MASEFPRPTKFPPGMFEGFIGAEDPAHLSRVAHDTAAALLSRVRADPDPEVVADSSRYTDEHGIDAIAELWSHASREEPAGRALAHLPAARAHPARSARHEPRVPARHRGLAHDRPGRRGRRRSRPAPTRSSSSPTASCTGCSRATSPSPSIAQRRSAGSPRPASRASPTTPMSRRRASRSPARSSPRAPYRLAQLADELTSVRAPLAARRARLTVRTGAGGMNALPTSFTIDVAGPQ